mgnify:CR=1 FL=1
MNFFLCCIYKKKWSKLSPLANLVTGEVPRQGVVAAAAEKLVVAPGLAGVTKRPAPRARVVVDSLTVVTARVPDLRAFASTSWVANKSFILFFENFLSCVLIKKNG